MKSSQYTMLKDVARFFSRLAYARFISRRPVVLSHLVTARCICRCDICLWRDQVEEELSYEEIARIYRQAKQQGIIFNYLWGGEPLVRQDIERIVSCSKDNDFITLLNTNGYFLPEKLEEMGKNLDFLVVSIDYPSEYHDQLRKRPGIYRRALAGIEQARKKFPHIKVILNTVMSKLNYDKIEEMIFLAAELGVSIYLSPMENGAGWSSLWEDWKAELMLNSGELSLQCQKVRELKLKGYPINNSLFHLETFIGGNKSFSCHFPQICLTLWADGRVPDCVSREGFLGNLRQIPLEQFYQSETYRKFLRRTKGCYKCNNADVIDTSLLWELRPHILWHTLRRAMAA